MKSATLEPTASPVVFVTAIEDPGFTTAMLLLRHVTEILLLWPLLLVVTLFGAPYYYSADALSSSKSSSSQQQQITPKLLQPFGKPSLPLGDDNGNRNIVRTHGVRVWDDSGNEYIDGIGSLWYCQVGYGRPEIIRAVAAQLESAMYNQFPPFRSDVAEACAARIVGLSSMREGGRAYLCSSGSEAIDTAFKIARAVAHGGGELPRRQLIVRRRRGYHGVNLGGTSAMGIASNREGWGDLMPHMVEIDAEDIESARALFRERGPEIAAVVVEPVQAAGGVFPPPNDTYLSTLRSLCTQYGALLIFDEVVTGFGRTGNWFASQTYDVVPDLMTFAKGATSGYQPLGGVVLSRDVCAALERDPEYVFRHGHTFSGHAAACAACLANVDVMEEERLLDRAVAIGERLSAGLRRLLDEGEIREVRGVGALWAARLNDDDAETAVAVRDRMLDLGVIVRPLYDSIAFCPPLVMNDADVDRMVDALAQAIRDVNE